MLRPLLVLPLLLFLGSDDEPEWGGFRGNNGTGVARAGGIPGSLDPEATALWVTEVPPGYSSPIVTGRRLFLTAEDGQRLVVLCLDREDGSELWRRNLEFDGARVGMNSSAAPTPVTDGERVYVLFHALGLHAFDLDGEELWSMGLGEFNIPHGMSTSPVVHGDTLFQLVDQDVSPFLLALDKRTGKELWRTPREGAAHGYSTPAIYQPAQGAAQVIVAGSYKTCGYDAATGKLIWWVEGNSWQTKAVPVLSGDTCFISAYMPPSTEFGVPAPEATWTAELELRDANKSGLIERDEWDHEMMQMLWFIFDQNGDEALDEGDWNYLGSSRRATGGLYAVDMTGQGDVTKTHVTWKFADRRGLPDIPSPLYVDGKLFLMESGLFTAIDAKTGEVTKRDRVGATDEYYASPIAAGDRIVTASKGGQLAVVTADADWKVLSVVDLEQEIWATPAIAGSQVFVRTQESLWCFDRMEDE